MKASFYLRGKQETKGIWVNDNQLKIDASRQVYTCADGFEWGEIEGGCTQLALAVCLYFLPFASAVAHFRDFTRKVIAKLPKGDFDVRITYDFESRELKELVNESTIKVKKTTKK